MCNYNFMKQKLSKTARAAKLARDKKAAMTAKRKSRKAQNQRIGQKSNSDIHHGKNGSVRRVSVKKNRGNFGKGTKKEGKRR